MAKPKTNPALRAFHARGKRANSRGEKLTSKHGVWGTMEELGAKTAAERNRLMEARRFAKLCDDEELEFLCELGQEEGQPLKKCHVLQLIRVSDKEKRRKLANSCALSGLSTRELQREIDGCGLHRTYGGRRQKPPETLEEALIVTERMAQSWIRWASVLKSVRGRKGKSRITLGKQPESIGGELDAISAVADKLRKKIAKRLDARTQKPRKKSRRRTR